jgi:glucokinase
MTLAIGVDVGGTKIAAGVVDEDGKIIARTRRETPHDPEPTDAINTMVGVITELTRGHDIEAVGIGFAGFIDAKRSTVLFATNLGWQDLALREAIERRTELPAVVENDANAAAWGEFRYGAAADVEDDMVLVTVGTGIGGGIIVDGRLLRGAFGVAAEIGHMRMVPGGLRCPCGNKGCWEQYASGSALVREGRALVESVSPLAERLHELCQGKPERLTGQHITEAAAEGDEAAIELIEELGQWLGEGLAQLVAVLDPGILVVGGGVSDAGELLLGQARNAFRRNLTGRTHRPEPHIRIATLGNDAGLVGAADLARIR